MTRFQLGDKVLFTDTVRKIRPEKDLTSWESAGLPIDYRRVVGGEKVSEGIILRQRFLPDYHLERYVESDDWTGKSFTITQPKAVPGTMRRAWLVGYDLHRKPVLVLDEHIKDFEYRVDDAPEGQPQAEWLENDE